MVYLVLLLVPELVRVKLIAFFSYASEINDNRNQTLVTEVKYTCIVISGTCTRKNAQLQETCTNTVSTTPY
jgi:hypothetical protein